MVENFTLKIYERLRISQRRQFHDYWINYDHNFTKNIGSIIFTYMLIQIQWCAKNLKTLFFLELKKELSTWTAKVGQFASQEQKEIIEMPQPFQRFDHLPLY